MQEGVVCPGRKEGSLPASPTQDLLGGWPGRTGGPQIGGGEQPHALGMEQVLSSRAAGLGAQESCTWDPSVTLFPLTQS